MHYAAAVRTGRMEVVRLHMDAEAEPAQLVFLDAGGQEIAVLDLAQPAGVVSGDVLELSRTVAGGLDSEGAEILVVGVAAADAAGQVVEARIRDGAGEDVVLGMTAGLAPAEGDPAPDVVMSRTLFAPGDTATVASVRLTHHRPI